MLSVNMSLVYTIINVLLLFVLVRVFLFKPVDKILNARKEEIEKELQDAKDAHKEADAAHEKFNTAVERLEADHDQILADARQKGYEEYEEIIEKAHAEAEEMIEAARVNAEEESQKWLKAYDEQIADMVIEAAGRIAATKHSDDNDRALYDKFIAQLSNDASAGNGSEG